jgi:MFS family permease
MKKPAYKWVALSVTTMGSLMVAIDSTIVILGLPNMLEDLHSNLVLITWVTTGYLLAATVLMLTFGRVADMFGRVKLYNLRVIVFTIGSVLCGLSPTDKVLIVMRLIQGAGGAMLAAMLEKQKGGLFQSSRQPAPTTDRPVEPFKRPMVGANQGRE